MNVMKKTQLALLIMMMGVGAVNAAITVLLGNGPTVSETTFTYGNLASTPSFDGGRMDATIKLTESSVSGARGSFMATWIPTHVVDASKWDFNRTEAMTIRPFSFGWGISDAALSENGSLNSNTDDAVLLSFDLAGLTLDAGKTLVFSFRTKYSGTQGNGAITIYKRSSASGGLNHWFFDVPNDIWSDSIEVEKSEGSVDFAIVQTSGADVISQFRIDVISASNLKSAPTTKDVPSRSGTSEDLPSPEAEYTTIGLITA